MLTDYHVHLRDDDGRRAGGAGRVHGRERRSLPGAAAEAGGIGGAGLLRARLQVQPPRSTSGGIRSGRSRRATTWMPTASSSGAPRSSSASRSTSCRAPRTGPRNLLEQPRLRLRAGLGSLRRRPRRRPRGLGHLGCATETPTTVWRRYFEALAEAARSGLFDVLAHPDLVKIWGRARPLPRAGPALLLRAGGARRSPKPGSRSRCRPPGYESRSGSSTRRPSSPPCASMPGRHFTLSSDAHSPADVGSRRTSAR